MIVGLVSCAGCGAPGPMVCPAVETAAPSAPVSADAPPRMSAELPECGPLPDGVKIAGDPLVDGMPAHRAIRGGVELLALCVDTAWRLVELEPRQIPDGEGFAVEITEAVAVDRTGDGLPEVEVAYRFTESLTALPPTGPFRRGEARVIVSDGADVLLRYYLSGETDAAVATDRWRMVGAAQWSTADQVPLLSVVQSILVTEDVVDDESDEHGRPATRVETHDASARWSGELGAFEVDGELWTVTVLGLATEQGQGAAD